MLAFIYNVGSSFISLHNHMRLVFIKTVLHMRKLRIYAFKDFAQIDRAHKRQSQGPTTQDRMTAQPVLNGIFIHHADHFDRCNLQDKHVLYTAIGNPCLFSLESIGNPSVSGSDLIFPTLYELPSLSHV